MSNQQDNDLLAKELGKLGSLGGIVGAGIPGAIGASLGASLVSQYLPTELCQQEVNVSLKVATVFAELVSFFTAKGRIVDDKFM